MLAPIVYHKIWILNFQFPLKNPKTYIHDGVAVIWSRSVLIRCDRCVHSGFPQSPACSIVSPQSCLCIYMIFLPLEAFDILSSDICNMFSCWGRRAHRGGTWYWNTWPQCTFTERKLQLLLCVPDYAGRLNTFYGKAFPCLE